MAPHQPPAKRTPEELAAAWAAGRALGKRLRRDRSIRVEVDLDTHLAIRALRATGHDPREERHER